MKRIIPLLIIGSLISFPIIAIAQDVGPESPEILRKKEQTIKNMTNRDRILESSKTTQQNDKNKDQFNQDGIYHIVVTDKNNNKESIWVELDQDEQKFITIKLDNSKEKRISINLDNGKQDHYNTNFLHHRKIGPALQPISF